MATSVAFCGLGAMGFGMACNLQKNGYKVTGYDVWQPSMDRFVASGGSIATSPRDAAAGNSLLISMVANAQQAESVLFDEKTGAVQALPQNSTILLGSTVPASFLDEINVKLKSIGREDVHLVDCPVSGGVVRAADGTLTILAAGTDKALAEADAVLKTMSEEGKLYRIPGGVGAASKVKMINQLLVGVHIAAASEAMALAARAGLNTREVFDIITNAAGNSWAFENRVPHMLDDDFRPMSALNIFVKDMGIVTSTARAQGFPLPLASAAEQLYLAGAAQGYGLEDDSGLVRMFLPQNPSLVHQQAKVRPNLALTPITTPIEINKIGFIGLGAMGFGMADSLLRAGFNVHGFDVYGPSVEKFTALGGKASAADSPADAANAAQVLILMVQNASQAQDVLFGSGKAADALPAGATVVLSSTVPPSFTRELGSQLAAMDRDITLVDAPVSGGVVRAAKGDLTIICSGEDKSFSNVNSVLAAMSGPPKNLCRVQGGIGAASSVKLINQLLAGVHIASAAEALSLGAKLGLDTRFLYDIIRTAAGNSWMFTNRAPAMLDGDWTPNSALAIFVKDLGIVLDEAKRLTFPATMSAAAHQLYLAGAASGWTRDADSSVVRIWEKISGVSVSGMAAPRPPTSPSQKLQAIEPRKYESLPAQQTLDALPPPYPQDVLGVIQQHIASAHAPVLVVLDDDPTGTQTCHDIAVLTVWDHSTLCKELLSDPCGFFILTNSRALPPAECKELIITIATAVAKAAEETRKQVEFVLRGDSTLRGHLPEEPEAIECAIGTFDGWILAPFFFQGGRYTIDDVHYVREGETLVPASETPFARDATFGYRSSNLRDYVLEKCPGRFGEGEICSVGIEDIRIGGPAGVAHRLLEAPKGGVIIVNAAAEADMFVFAAGLLEAEKRGKRFLYRTAAAFVSCRLGISGIEPLTMADLGIEKEDGQMGGLIVAGSYVPKTTAQLKALRERRGDRLHVVELDVEAMIGDREAAEQVTKRATVEATENIGKGKDVLIMTSRNLITGKDGLESLNIGSVVAKALVSIVENIDVRPRYLIAKGGITSSDAATKGLRMKRAMVVGQAAKGVPLWRCDEETSRHMGIPYVVFPGNVGGDDTLAELVERWAF
ncbi:hypothetical protein K402DRAFT_398192 [Aulographum hederae CBS 113979]|uniref:3-hydroxyisobutyrate dehydrogenase n=1 Tax=Aulographum hederae CBS 113979 TaxID=1176131 RepID=A0A6G1GM14_9PEZI|nr:hypothetical protein K402DRAFT_398192 [Aulographum hederae CBS 113979]